MGFIFQSLLSLCCHASAKYTINNYPCVNISVGDQSTRDHYYGLLFLVQEQKSLSLQNSPVSETKLLLITRHQPCQAFFTTNQPTII